MGAPIGDWDTDELQRFVTRIIPVIFTRPKNFKVDSLDVDNILVRNQFQHKPEGIRLVTFAGGWGDVGAPFGAMHYWKDPWGIVHLSGLITTAGGFPNGNGIVAFTLPVGYRPPTTIRLPQRSGLPGSGFIDIAANGTVTPTADGIALFGAVGDITVEGTFRV